MNEEACAIANEETFLHSIENTCILLKFEGMLKHLTIPKPIKVRINSKSVKFFQVIFHRSTPYEVVYIEVNPIKSS